MNTGKVIIAVLAAAGGAALGVLFAPDKGKETRRKISYKREKYADKLEATMNDFKSNISKKIETAKSEMSKKKRNAQEAIEETKTGDFGAGIYLSPQNRGEFSTSAPI